MAAPASHGEILRGDFLFRKNEIHASVPSRLLPCPTSGPGRGNGDWEHFWRTKNLEVTLLIWIYCKPLKSHKTAKAFFGNPWHWNRISLESLAKNLEASIGCHEAAGRPTTAPHSTRRPSEGLLLPL
jgi:hypothetical protein